MSPSPCELRTFDSTNEGVNLVVNKVGVKGVTP
jgi:hypothetical protein